jgi:hypothetical protein
MNFAIFSTAVSKPDGEENVQNSPTACFSGFFEALFLKFK